MALLGSYLRLLLYIYILLSTAQRISHGRRQEAGGSVSSVHMVAITASKYVNGR